jgi:hypothetical protein
MRKLAPASNSGQVSTVKPDVAVLPESISPAGTKVPVAGRVLGPP